MIYTPDMGSPDESKKAIEKERSVDFCEAVVDNHLLLPLLEDEFTSLLDPPRRDPVVLGRQAHRVDRRPIDSARRATCRGDDKSECWEGEVD